MLKTMTKCLTKAQVQRIEAQARALERVAEQCKGLDTSLCLDGGSQDVRDTLTAVGHEAHTLAKDLKLVLAMHRVAAPES